MPDLVTRRRLAASLLAAALVPALLVGCGTGFNAYTGTQGQSGNGVFTTVGPVLVQNATLVLGPEGDNSATLTATFYNSGTDPDLLVKAAIEPPAGTTLITGDRLLLPPAKDVRVGYESVAHINFYDVELKPATYVPLTLQFEKAGQTTIDVLVVPAEGSYEGIRPVPARPLPQVTATPSA